MFWKGKIGLIPHLTSYIKQKDLALSSLPAPELDAGKLSKAKPYKISVGCLHDIDGIAKLLNKYFEQSSSKAKTQVTTAWIRSTFLDNHAIWIIAKDPMGTIRGCISSFKCERPYPNSFDSGCRMASPWGIVDWFCVEPLWRSKGIGTELLETLDLITYRVGRKAHIFLKEGPPLPFPHIPFYCTFLKCRKAGNPQIKRMTHSVDLALYPYQAVERATGLPLVRVEGIRGPTIAGKIEAWEDLLDKELPECWVFVSGADLVDEKREWRADSMVSVYAFRWIPGKWFGSVPNPAIL